MILTFDDVLQAGAVARITDSLKPGDFDDGKLTAGWHAKLVKNNTQLTANDERTKSILTLAHEAVLKHAEFNRAFKPKITRRPMISRYVPGMSYGTHVDDPLMGANPVIRTDISMTLFLSDPASYKAANWSLKAPSARAHSSSRPAPWWSIPR